MSTPSLKQQKTFALVRIIGGFAAAAVLGYSFIANVLAGQPAEGPVLLTGVMALVGLGYAAFGGLTAAHVAAVNALAAGAILAMIADTMIPEAFETAHEYAGLITVLGFLTAFALSRWESAR